MVPDAEHGGADNILARILCLPGGQEVIKSIELILRKFELNSLRWWEQYCKLPWPDTIAIYLKVIDKHDKNSLSLLFSALNVYFTYQPLFFIHWHIFTFSSVKF